MSKLSITDLLVYLALVEILFVFSGCQKATLPDTFTEAENQAVIYPDYTDTTIPPNIAPMNFLIEEPGDRFITRISSDKGVPILVVGRNVDIPIKKWRTLLKENKGNSLTIDIYSCSKGKWVKYQTITNRISDDPIDPWVFYRLIEPGYEFAHRISLNQRNLESFHEEAFFDNRSVPNSPCVNCHAGQDRRTERFMFHFRRNADPLLGGTVIVDHNRIRKLGTNLPEIGNSCTYPAWHPTENLLAFSANKTRQRFHSRSVNKIEVFDYESDLVLLDPETQTISSVTKTPVDFETFPSWSPAGDALYFCSAHLDLEELAQKDQNPDIDVVIVDHYMDFKYNLMRMSFDAKTRTFGKPEVVVDAAALDKSIVHPRVSPDGNYLIYTMSAYGTFPIWHPDSDLYQLDLRTGESRRMDEINSDQSESYHTWTSNGHWLVFSSRRDTGSYTRLYFTHMDNEGMGSKPFLLPQKNPLDNVYRFKSYNVPEMMQEPVHVNLRTLANAAGKFPEQARYDNR